MTFIADLILLLSAMLPTPVEADIAPRYHGFMCTASWGVCEGFAPGTILVQRGLPEAHRAWVVEHEAEHWRRWRARLLGFDLGDPADERAADAAACRAAFYAPCCAP